MGGFFGIASKCDCMMDVFFGVDYHSHLGTRRGGMAAWDAKIGLQRVIHSIENAPFRTKFEHIFDEMQGSSVIGCISDSDPQPLLIRGKMGTFAISTVGIVNNADALIDQYLTFRGGHFDAMTGGKVNSTELVAALISQQSNFVEGIKFVQQVVEGTVNILILTDEGKLIAARDKLTSGCVSCTFFTPSGAATRHISRMLLAPLFLTIVIASVAEPPVASIGSTMITSLSSISWGILQ